MSRAHCGLRLPPRGCALCPRPRQSVGPLDSMAEQLCLLHTVNRSLAARSGGSWARTLVLLYHGHRSRMSPRALSCRTRFEHTCAGYVRAVTTCCPGELWITGVTATPAATQCVVTIAMRTRANTRLPVLVAAFRQLLRGTRRIGCCNDCEAIGPLAGRCRWPGRAVEAAATGLRRGAHFAAPCIIAADLVASRRFVLVRRPLPTCTAF